MYSIIKDKTQTAASADAAFESRLNDYLTRKKVEKTIARTDIVGERMASEVQKKAQVATTVYHEPYFVATSTGLGTSSARANSIDAGLAFLKKVKESQS